MEYAILWAGPIDVSPNDPPTPNAREERKMNKKYMVLSSDAGFLNCGNMCDELVHPPQRLADLRKICRTCIPHPQFCHHHRLRLQNCNVERMREGVRVPNPQSLERLIRSFHRIHIEDLWDFFSRYVLFFAGSSNQASIGYKIFVQVLTDRTDPHTDPVKTFASQGLPEPQTQDGPPKDMIISLAGYLSYRLILGQLCLTPI